MPSSPDQKRWPARIALAASALAALAAWIEVVRVGLFKRFSIDEFQYAHAAWLVSHGKVPYRDFFEFHFPLPYLSYAPFISDDPASIGHLRLFMLVVFALTSFGIYRINRELGPALALTGPIVLATTTPFTFFATEIRPDPVAFALFVLALSLFFPAPVTPRRACAIGALWVLALFASQKAIIYTAPLGLVLVVDAIRARSPFNARLLEAWRPLLLGAGGVALVIALYFLFTRSGTAWLEQTLIWARYHERHYPGFPWTRYAAPAFESSKLLCLLGFLGAVRTVLALKRSDAPLARPELSLLLLLASTLYSYGFARAPFPYALVPGLGMLAVFVPRGLAFAFEWLGGEELPRAAHTAGVVLILAASVWLGPRLGFVESERKLHPNNDYQYRVLADLARLTKVTDPVYDDSGSYVSRPSVGFRFYTSALDRTEEATTLPLKMEREVRASGCTALLLDARFHGLPPPLQRFLAQHYQPYSADILLWGQRFSPVHSLATFEAVRDADYFVEPETVATGGGFEIDGNENRAAVFHLSRGMHQIQYSGGAREFWISWLPADGQRYRPRYGLRPEFSSIF
ncbi:MAG TPA: hypothetical protein VHV51_22255 [Polyangiaceae bacterium]|nr:hypothetical protein [Polyangiaceae bacterium]